MRRFPDRAIASKGGGSGELSLDRLFQDDFTNALIVEGGPCLANIAASMSAAVRFAMLLKTYSATPLL